MTRSRPHVLLLGGTSEASALARLLAARSDIPAMVSLAGRTINPAPPPIAHRIGGFGGVEGLCAFLEENAVTALIEGSQATPDAKTRAFRAKNSKGSTVVRGGKDAAAFMRKFLGE